MKLTKEQRAELIEKLSWPWGCVALICDGNRVALQVHQLAGTAIRHRVFTYVNGHFKGEWMTREAPEQKFLRKSVVALYKPAERKRIEKIVGKRRFATDPAYAGFHKTLTHYLPDWASGKAAIDHLCRVCESVEIAPAEEVTS